MKEYVLPAFVSPSEGASVFCLRVDESTMDRIKKIQELQLDGSMIIPSCDSELVCVDNEEAIDAFSEDENIADCSYSMEELEKLADGTDRLADLKEAINSGTYQYFRICVSKSDICVLIEASLDDFTYFVESYEVQI